MKYEKSCGAVCFLKTGKDLRVLLVCHKYGGHWAYPKGHVEKDETEEETAHREVLEETGIPIKIIPGLRRISSYSPAKNVIKEVVYFVAEALEEAVTPQPEEIRAAEFVKVEDAAKRLTYAADRELLKSAKLFLENC
ncbi:MAG: NUDIX domain-containing protein [Oscillospiraceae bacterium]|nr:NUDIX domain-containing protein [Oscillospiraceae bacterium]